MQSIFTWERLQILIKKDVCLNYMVRGGNKYVQPNKAELSWQPIENILFIMLEPKLVNNRSQFPFERDSLEKANLKARSLPGVKNINFKQKRYFF